LGLCSRSCVRFWLFCVVVVCCVRFLGKHCGLVSLLVFSCTCFRRVGRVVVVVEVVGFGWGWGVGRVGVGGLVFWRWC